uniref:Uncharacterized protein n=1 Tax=Tanacetum cinerariifolium TaxID=118510 RepID=A0A699HQF3_TANCI|nr:hypothetical protein [Tanacetum cinerariifolium]
MVTGLEDSKTHNVGEVWSGEYMNHCFIKSMSELDRCYTMLQELRSVIVGGELIHKNREGSKHEGQRIRPIIGDFGGNCVSNQSPFNNGRIEEWDEEKKEDRVPTTKIFRKRIAMVSPNVTPQLPKPEVKVEENIIKAEVVDEHVEKIQDLQSYKEHDDKISTLLFQTTNKVGTLKTCEEIMVSNDDEDVKGFNCELKTDFECVHNLNVRDLDYGLILRMIIRNQVMFSMKNREVKSIIIENLGVVEKEYITRCFGSWVDRWEFCRHVKNIKVNEVRDWSSPKTSLEVRNNKFPNVFQEEDELEYGDLLDEEAKQVTYVVQRTLCLPKALVKAFKLPTEPHPSPYQFRRIKKGLTLKVTEICRVSLAMEKHYNELVLCDVVDMETCVVSPKKKLESETLATLMASPKDFQAERKETGVFYALVMKGVEDVMENEIAAVIKPLLAEFDKIVKDDTPDALPPLRNIQHQIDLSRKTTLLVSISNEVLGFDSIKELYANDEDYGNIWMRLETNQHQVIHPETASEIAFV